MEKCCALIGSSPKCFPWGFDENHENCAALKLQLIHQVMNLQTRGCTRFAINMDCGFGLYAAEIISSLKKTDGRLSMDAFIPFEQQSSRWTPTLQDRYNRALMACRKIEYASRSKTLGCVFRAQLMTMRDADTVIFVYDPDSPACERESAAAEVAALLHKHIIPIDPKQIRL